MPKPYPDLIGESSRSRLLTRQSVPILVLAITALGCGLRVWHLGQDSFWSDELFTVFYVKTGLHYLWTDGFWLETNPPSYYTLVAGWIKVFGDSEVAVRSLSVLCSSVAIPIVYLIGRALAGAACGVVGALILALAPMEIYFAQEARVYALTLIPVGLAMLGASRFLDDIEDARALVLYGVGSACAVYAHSTLVLLVIAFNLVAGAALLLVEGRDRWRGLARWATTNAVVALLSLPELYAMVTQVHHNRIAWVQPPTRQDIEYALSYLFIGPNAPPDKLIGWLTRLFCAMLAVVILGARPPRRVTALLVALPLIDFALVLLAGLRQPILIPRILTWMWLPTSLLLGWALTTPSRLRPALGIAVTSLLTVGLYYQFEVNGVGAKDPWRPLLAQLRPELDAADLIVMGPWTQPLPIAFYSPDDLGKTRRWSEALPPTVESTVIARKLGVPEISRDELLDALRAGRRVLLLQRAYEFYYQKVLSGAPAPASRIEAQCSWGRCLEAIYWTPSVAPE